MGVFVLPTSFDLVEQVKADYVAGEIEVAELESELEGALRGEWPHRLLAHVHAPRDPTRPSTY